MEELQAEYDIEEAFCDMGYPSDIPPAEGVPVSTRSCCTESSMWLLWAPTALSPPHLENVGHSGTRTDIPCTFPLRSQETSSQFYKEFMDLVHSKF